MIINSKKAGITPSGSIEITDTNVTDVTQYATAQVVDADLVAENIKKDVNILGVVGSFEGGTPSPLPSGYTQMEYLESSGTQYIATTHVPTAEEEIEVKFLRAREQATRAADFGCDPPRFFSLGIYQGYGNGTTETGSSYSPDNLIASNVISGSLYRGAEVKYMHLFYKLSGLYDAGGERLINFGSTAMGEGTTPITIFGINRNGIIADKPCAMRLFGFAISNRSQKIMELIPAMRDADSVLGMYDIVNDVFYTNAGTGTFTGGALS